MGTNKYLIKRITQKITPFHIFFNIIEKLSKREGQEYTTIGNQATRSGLQ